MFQWIGPDFFSPILLTQYTISLQHYKMRIEKRPKSPVIVMRETFMLGTGQKFSVWRFGMVCEPLVDD